eukprot:TRINITY_DN55384_c0_g1_i1.p1 TRINITY_DN55384_c0_g1~~TRINITY_DN55384_c0_g1_i1.p1  ORF type:complete len:309 (+),score=30.83 TRINITY_DN55384_c0_g1_i1:69-995(+)
MAQQNGSGARAEKVADGTPSKGVTTLTPSGFGGFRFGFGQVHDRTAESSPSEEDLHQTWIADPEPEWMQGCQGRCVRRGPVVMNGVLAVAAAILVMSGALARESSVTEMCDECKSLSTVAIAVGAVFCGFALLAYVAVWRDWRGVIVLYIVVLIIVSFTLIGMCVAGGIFAGRGVDLSPAWRARVANHNQRICSLQVSYKCSGWDRCCGRSPDWTRPPVPATWTASPTPVNSTPAPSPCTWDPGECMADCPVDEGDKSNSCKSAVQGWLHITLALFVVGVAGALALIVALGYTSLRIRRLVKYPKLVN